MRHFFKDILEPISYLIYAIAIFVNLLFSKSTRRKVLFVYYLVSTVAILVACYTTRVHVNRIIYNLYFLVTIICFSYYFYYSMENHFKRNIIKGLLIVNAILFVASVFRSNHFLEINNYGYAIIYLSIVIYALFYFENVISNVSERNLLHQFDFYLTSSYLLYYLSCFFIIFFYDNVPINQRALLWSLQNAILFLSSALTMSGSLWIYYQNRRS